MMNDNSLSRPRHLPIFSDHDLEAETSPDGVGLTLVGLPSPVLARRGLHVPSHEDLTPAALALLTDVYEALRYAATLEERTIWSAIFSLEALPSSDRDELWDMLGEGEVSVVVQGSSRYEIEETALPGVYRVRTKRSDDAETLHLEVGAIPAIVVHAALHGTSGELPLEDPPPAGIMNAQPLLAELRHRMAMGDGPSLEANHVISLTLLPLNDADATYLSRVLGAGPVRGESRGYGTCRVRTTSRRGVWSVQYFNAMDTLILDTLEVGPQTPAVLVAAPMDLEDSAVRLKDLLGAEGELER